MYACTARALHVTQHLTGLAACACACACATPLTSNRSAPGNPAAFAVPRLVACARTRKTLPALCCSAGHAACKPARSVSHPSHRTGSAGAGRPRHARRTCPPTEATAGPAATLFWPARGRCRAWPQAARTRRAAPCSARGRAAGSHAAAARKGGQAAGRGAGHLENVQHLGHVGDVARHLLDVLRARGRCPVSAQHAIPRACALGRAGRTWLMSGRVPVARSASSSWRPPAFSSCHARPPASTSVPCRRARGSVARRRGPAAHQTMHARRTCCARPVPGPDSHAGAARSACQPVGMLHQALARCVGCASTSESICRLAHMPLHVRLIPDLAARSLAGSWMSRSQVQRTLGRALVSRRARHEHGHACTRVGAPAARCQAGGRRQR